MTDRVLPGNPESDWTEQDERDLQAYASLDGVSGTVPRFAREILRLRVENERHVAEISRLGAALYRLEA